MSITCVLCVPLRTRLFFRSCCRLVSNFTHRTALCLPTEFPFACCCVLKPHPLLVLFLLLPARSCLERRWGLAHLRLWAPRLRRPWFTPLVGEAPVRPERFQGASSKACSRGQRVEEDTEQQATQQHEKEHGQQQCANTTSTREYARCKNSLANAHSQQPQSPTNHNGRIDPSGWVSTLSPCELRVAILYIHHASQPFHLATR